MSYNDADVDVTDLVGKGQLREFANVCLEQFFVPATDSAELFAQSLGSQPLYIYAKKLWMVDSNEAEVPGLDGLFCLDERAANFCEDLREEPEQECVYNISNLWNEETEAENSSAKYWILWIVSAGLFLLLVLLLFVEYILQTSAEKKEVKETLLMEKVATANTLSRKKSSEVEFRNVSMDRNRAADNARP